MCISVLIGACALRGFTVLGFGQQQGQAKIPGEKTKRPDKTYGLEQRVPRYQVYEHLITVIGVLDRNADEAKYKGEDDTRYRQFYRRAANLTPDQWTDFQRIMSEARNELADIDGQADQIIVAYREKLKQAGNNGPPPIPEKIKDLQTRHNRVLSEIPHKLKAAFGDKEFEKFDKFLRETIQVNKQGVKNGGTGGNKKEGEK